MADTPAVKPTVKRTTQPNRFMLTFGTKYKAAYDRILKDADVDDRDPGEFMVRWLDKNYKPVSVEGSVK